MPASLADYVIDGALAKLDEAERVYICSQEPATFLEASSTYALGVKTFGAGGVFGVAAAGSPNGRKIPTIAVTDGVVSGNGTAAWEAWVDFTNSRLLGDNPLSATQVVTAGNSWSRAAYDVRIPGQ